MISEMLKKFYVVNADKVLENHKCEICQKEVKRNFRTEKEVRNAFIIVVKKNGYAMRLCKYHFNRYLKQKPEKIKVAFNNFMVIKP